MDIFGYQKMRKKKWTDFYWVMLLMYTIWEHWNFLPPDIVQKSLLISSHFDAQRLNIIQKPL